MHESSPNQALSPRSQSLATKLRNKSCYGNMEAPDSATSKSREFKSSRERHFELLETSTSVNSCTKINLRVSLGMKAVHHEVLAFIVSTSSSNNEEV